VNAQPNRPAVVENGDRLRVDKWLWHARFFKSRTLAAKSVGAGHVRVNRQVIRKPNYMVQPGDVLTFPLGPHIRVIEVVALGERRGPAPEARTLYTDLDPPQPRPRSEPRIEPSERRESGSGRPTKRDRRITDRLKQSADFD
jgi:ribosome-associated heat shock protein Hsp15